MTEMACSSCVIYEIPVAVSPDAPGRTAPAVSIGGTKSVRASRTKAERVNELRKLVGPGRRITAVLRRANGRFVVYTEPDTSEVLRDISKPDSLK
jgi:hypothetical protein